MTRRILISSALVLGVLVAGLYVAVRTGLLKAEPTLHEIELRNGELLRGLILPKQTGVYLVQTEDLCVQLDYDEIRSIDGEAVAPIRIPTADARPTLQDTFEEIDRDGTVTVHSRMPVTNRGYEPLRTLSWGLKPHEMPFLESMRILDDFGNELALQTVPGGSTPHMLRATLTRPLLPGEAMAVTHVYRDPKLVRHTEDVWVYRHRGDYPDNRLVTRSVLLPPGAEVVAISPEPIHQIEIEACQLIVWRRYFAEGEVIPWEIRYRLQP